MSVVFTHTTQPYYGAAHQRHVPYLGLPARSILSANSMNHLHARHLRLARSKPCTFPAVLSQSKFQANSLGMTESEAASRCSSCAMRISPRLATLQRDRSWVRCSCIEAVSRAELKRATRRSHGQSLSRVISRLRDDAWPMMTGSLWSTSHHKRPVSHFLRGVKSRTNFSCLVSWIDLPKDSLI
jgi:hypothetical protein